jgi:hypothetical protein
MSSLPRCEVVPEPHAQASFRIDGREVTRWQFGDDAPGPYFYPLVGPESGASLTRMGHPGAQNHDHHRSVWFAHHKVLGIDFWGIAATSRIRQRLWHVYEDRNDCARMAVLLDWLDGHDPQPLVEQELIATLRPLEQGEYTLSLQSTFRPRIGEVEFQQTNFGFLAVRVAKSISGHFGGGVITSSAGAVGEEAIFGQPAEWMDYSGLMAKPAMDGGRVDIAEGITYFDHPGNVSFPSKWHVREDGWMGASACRDRGIVITREQPLVLRYLLHVHRGGADAARAEAIASQWRRRPLLQVRKSMQPHSQFEVVEIDG